MDLYHQAATSMRRSFDDDDDDDDNVCVCVCICCSLPWVTSDGGGCGGVSMLWWKEISLLFAMTIVATGIMKLQVVATLPVWSRWMLLPRCTQSRNSKFQTLDVLSVLRHDDLRMVSEDIKSYVRSTSNENVAACSMAL